MPGVTGVGVAMKLEAGVRNPVPARPLGPLFLGPLVIRSILEEDSEGASHDPVAGKSLSLCGTLESLLSKLLKAFFSHEPPGFIMCNYVFPT
jgi:hypothetical protein